VTLQHHIIEIVSESNPVIPLEEGVSEMFVGGFTIRFPYRLLDVTHRQVDLSREAAVKRYPHLSEAMLDKFYPKKLTCASCGKQLDEADATYGFTPIQNQLLQEKSGWREHYNDFAYHDAVCQLRDFIFYVNEFM
jgi:hypothetical protein